MSSEGKDGATVTLVKVEKMDDLWKVDKDTYYSYAYLDRIVLKAKIKFFLHVGVAEGNMKLRELEILVPPEPSNEPGGFGGPAPMLPVVKVILGHGHELIEVGGKKVYERTTPAIVTEAPGAKPEGKDEVLVNKLKDETSMKTYAEFCKETGTDLKKAMQPAFKHFMQSALTGNQVGRHKMQGYADLRKTLGALL
mmetsp:Transcript_28324/g.55053  ORF Transcript_28324/g.55053 Transcript_28324/m.55053 type:complete len:195 (-) Transcript_28324:32-616(-)